MNKSPMISIKQSRFVAAYLRTGNAKAAAAAAGYSKKTAEAQGCRLLRNVKIRLTIEGFRQKTEDDTVCALLERKRILSQIARGKIGDYVTAGQAGTGVNFGPESNNPSAVASIKSRTTENGAVITEIKLESKTTAIDLLNKMDGVYVEKHELSGSFVLSSDPELDKAL